MEDKFNPIVDERQYGYVYRITHMETGKTYIGMHKITVGEHWRFYMGSGSLLAKYKARYGSEAFSKELLGYGNSFSALKTLESEFITAERAIGKGELNLDECGLGTRNYFKELRISDTDVLSLYFDEKMSLDEIVKHYNFTFTRNQLDIHLKKIEGFKNRQIASGEFSFETKVARDPKTGTLVEKIVVKGRNVKIECPNCHRQITKSQLQRHQGSKSCLTGEFPVCAMDGCDKVLSKLTATHCKNHYGHAIGKKNVENFHGVDRKVAGSLGSHQRHHVAKNICTELCSYCVASGNTFTITKQEIFDLFAKGKSGPFIKEKYGVSMGTVFNWRQAYRASLQS